MLRFHGIDKLLQRHVLTEIDNLIASRFQHGFNKVFTDIMCIAFNNADNRRLFICRKVLFQMRLQHIHTGIHGIGTQKNIGNEVLFFFIHFAGSSHAVNKAFHNTVQSLIASVYIFLARIDNIFIIHFKYIVRQSL